MMQRFVLQVLLFGACGCAPLEPAQDDLLRYRLLPLSIVFEPPLTTTGKLSVVHESGWTFEGKAAPSGIDLRMPEGPASLRLWVGTRLYERQIKVARGNSRCVWLWQP